MTTAFHRSIAAWIDRPLRLRWVACLVATIALGLQAGAARADTIFVTGASTLEGNAGTKVLNLPVFFLGNVANTNTVTGLVSAIASTTGGGFNASQGGAACGPAGVDFEEFRNVPFTILPGAPHGSLNIGIRICSDAVVEPNEHILVTLTNVVGADCVETSCGAVGTISNDDGAPTISIGSIATSEPLVGSVSAFFPVTLSHPINEQISVRFATRNGTATAGSDFIAKAGTLLIPANSPAGSIGVSILGGVNGEPAETFFVDLSSQSANATLAVASGRATIRNVALSSGAFTLSPDAAEVLPGEKLVYALDWSVPANQVWRNLKTIEMRLRGGHGTALWLRWDEASNEFSLCRKAGHAGSDDDDDDDEGDSKGRSGALAQRAMSKVICSAGALPGTAAVLSTPFATLHLADTSVQGSGPTGATVSLTLALSFGGKAAGHAYRVELTAADDFGTADRFVAASRVSVEKPGKR